MSSTLLEADPLAPFGVRSDDDAVLASVQRGWDAADVQVVEMSDLERAEDARPQSTVSQGDAQFSAALSRADRTFGRILATVDPRRDLVMVVAPMAPAAGEQLTMFAIRGVRIDAGWARSPTTRRTGFVTLTDIAPTILDAFDVEAPSEMNDTPITSVADDASLVDRADRMVRADERARFHGRGGRIPITVAFSIVGLVALLIAVMVAVDADSSWRRPLRWCSLAVIATPSMMFLSGLLPYDPFSVATFGL